jgi:hypothetical protein
MLPFNLLLFHFILFYWFTTIAVADQQGPLSPEGSQGSPWWHLSLIVSWDQWSSMACSFHSHGGNTGSNVGGPKNEQAPTCDFLPTLISFCWANPFSAAKHPIPPASATWVGWWPKRMALFHQSVLCCGFYGEVRCLVFESNSGDFATCLARLSPGKS